MNKMFYICTIGNKQIEIMKISKTNVKKFNLNLLRNNLELESDKYTKETNCYCISLNPTKEELMSMNDVRVILSKSKVLSDIIYNPYFKG